MTNNGKAFENAVAELHKLFGEESKISQNVIIEDTYGIKREFDIVLKAKVNNYDILGLVECKDNNRKVSIQVVDAFAKKCESVNANFKVIFSKKGFSNNAVKLAEKYGIKAHSLVDNEKSDLSIKVFWLLYGRIMKYRFLVGEIDTAKDINNSEPLPFNEIFFRKRSLFELVCQNLVKHYGGSHEIKPGRYQVSVEVEDDNRRYVTIKNKRYLLKKCNYTIEVECDLRKKKLPLEVKGIFDWHIKKMHLPPVENNMATAPFRFDDVQEWGKCDEIIKDDVPKFIVTYCQFNVDKFKENLEMIGKVKIENV
jgi:hypothetical protein